MPIRKKLVRNVEIRGESYREIECEIVPVAYVLEPIREEKEYYIEAFARADGLIDLFLETIMRCVFVGERCQMLITTLQKDGTLCRRAIHILRDVKLNGKPLLKKGLNKKIERFRSARSKLVHDTVLGEEGVLKMHFKGVKLKDSEEMHKKIREAKEREIERALTILDELFKAYTKIKHPEIYKKIKNKKAERDWDKIKEKHSFGLITAKKPEK